MMRSCTIRRTRPHACKAPRPRPRHRIRLAPSMPRVQPPNPHRVEDLPAWVRRFTARDGSAIVAVVAASAIDGKPEIQVTAWLDGEPVTLWVRDRKAAAALVHRDQVASYYVDCIHLMRDADAHEWFGALQATLLRVKKARCRL